MSGGGKEHIGVKLTCRRKATSLIRQFDIYTPIISMTSNVQTRELVLRWERSLH